MTVKWPIPQLLSLPSLSPAPSRTIPISQPVLSASQESDAQEEEEEEEENPSSRWGMMHVGSRQF